jgi:hypothetical protein
MGQLSGQCWIFQKKFANIFRCKLVDLLKNQGVDIISFAWQLPEMSLLIGSGNVTETQYADFVEWVAQILGQLLDPYLHPLLGADAVCG